MTDRLKKIGKRFYDNFWINHQTLTCDEKCRLQFVLSNAKTAINHGTDTAIADIGCGRGWLTKALSNFGKVTGFDQSTVEAARRYPRLCFVECDVLDMREAECFDLVVCSEVIEHIRRKDQPRLLLSISKILRSDGTLILTTPNHPVATAAVEKLGLWHELQPVENWLDAVALRKLLTPHFDVQKLTTLMFFPMNLRKIGPLSRIYRLFYEQCGGYYFLDSLLRPTFKGLYLAVIARKKSGTLKKIDQKGGEIRWEYQ